MIRRSDLANDKVDSGRRKLVNLLLGGAGAAWLGTIAYPLVRYLIPPKLPEALPTTLKVAKAEDVAPNSAIMFKYGRTPGILIRTPDGTFRAFSAVCTHLACIVQFRADWGIIWCACHNGHYDQNGNVISGPPPRPLAPFEVNIVNGEVYVSEKGI